MKRSALLAAPTLIWLAFIAGCGSDSFEKPAPLGSFVRIESISPAIGMPFREGETVTLEVKIKYALNAESGTIALVVQTANNSAVAQEIEAVTRGSGDLALKTQFVVPQTKTIMVYTPLSAQGQGATTTVDDRAYKVVAK
jgi:hypothetical protein